MGVGRALLMLGIAMSWATTSVAAERPRSSWGRAGVGFDQYRADAVECGRAGLATDIADLDAVKRLAAASKRIDSLLENQRSTIAPDGTLDPAALNIAQQVASTVEGTNPRARIREVRTVLLSTIEQCLTAKGYVRFDLTEDQRRHLGRLRIGSPERHAYLHALASDADVLARQRATVEVLPAE